MIPRPVAYMLTALLVVVWVAGAFIYETGPALAAVVACVLGCIVAGTRAPTPGAAAPAELEPTPAPEPRADAEYAEYLNDADRAWLTGHGWTDPAEQADEQTPEVVDDRGWRTVSWPDGRVDEYAATDPDPHAAAMLQRWQRRDEQRAKDRRARELARQPAVDNPAPRVTSRCSTCQANTPAPDELGRCARCSSPAAAAAVPDPSDIFRQMIDAADENAAKYRALADKMAVQSIRHAGLPPVSLGSVPQEIAVAIGPPPVAEFHQRPTLDARQWRTIRLWPTPDPDVVSVTARPDMVVVEMRDGTRHEIGRS